MCDMNILIYDYGTIILKCDNLPQYAKLTLGTLIIFERKYSKLASLEFRLTGSLVPLIIKGLMLSTVIFT